MIVGSVLPWLGAAAMTLAVAAGGQPLDAYAGRARVLVVVASDAADGRLIEQRRLFAAMRGEARERDLVLVEAVGRGPAALALRERFGLGAAGFGAVLVGKDGGGKLSSAEPLGAERLVPLIDAMPMRRDEMRRR